MYTIDREQNPSQVLITFKGIPVAHFPKDTNTVQLDSVLFELNTLYRRMQELGRQVAELRGD